MSAQTNLFAPGFGQRLREERNRLGLSQEEFADLAGIKRLAQSQYEHEVREPRLSYLAALVSQGINLDYLLYGKTSSDAALPTEETRRIEKKVFDLIEEYVSSHCGGALTSEGRYVLFEVMRSHCIQAELNGRSGQEELAAFLPKRSGAHG